jgi:hypothetical protein
MSAIEIERGETLTLIITAKDADGEVVDLNEGVVEGLSFFDIVSEGGFPFQGAGRYERMEGLYNGGFAYRRQDSTLQIGSSGYFTSGSGYVMVLSPVTLGSWNWYLFFYESPESALALGGSENFEAEPANAPDPTTLEWDVAPPISFQNAIYENNYQWVIDSWIKSTTKGRVHESMEPEITEDGRVVLGYDTARLPSGSYIFDIRFTNNGRDQFTREFQLNVGGTVTPYSPR